MGYAIGSDGDGAEVMMMTMMRISTHDLIIVLPRTRNNSQEEQSRKLSQESPLFWQVQILKTISPDRAF